MWLPDRPSEPVIDNWPPKSLPIYADIDYERRCKCHPADAYATCVRCPDCHHSSFDPMAGACERRRCGHVSEVTLP